MDGQSTTAVKRRANGQQNIVSSEPESDECVKENTSEVIEDEDEIEFVPLAFLVSSWEKVISFFIPASKESISDENASFITKLSTRLSLFWTQLLSLFYRKKSVRRSRRLLGLGPEMEAEVARRRSRAANGSKHQANEALRNELEDEEITVAAVITEMDSDEEETEFIPLAIIVTMWERFLSLFTKQESTHAVEEKDLNTETAEDSLVNKDSMTKSLLGYGTYFWTFLTSFFYRPKMQRKSRMLQGLGPEVLGQNGNTRNRSTKRNKLSDVSTGEVADIESSAKEESFEIEKQEEEFIPLAVAASFCYWVLNLFKRSSEEYSSASSNGVPQANGLNLEESETKSTWSLSWIDWDYLRQMLPVNNGQVEVISSNLAEANGIIETSNLEPQKTNKSTSMWAWLVGLMYREKPTRRSRRLRGLGAELEAAAEVRRTRKGKTGKADDKSEIFSDDEDSLTCETEFIPMAWVCKVYQGICLVLSTLLYRKTGTDQEERLVLLPWLTSRLPSSSPQPSNLSRENLARHDARIAAGGSEASVGTWLGNSHHSDATQETEAEVAFQEVETTKEPLETAVEPNSVKLKRSLSMVEKANNMFAFMFGLGFLPKWSTSWFWGYKGSRKSRRQRGLEPIELEAAETWKSRTRRGTAKSRDSASIKDCESETSEEEEADKHLHLLLFFLLGMSLLYLLLIHPFCSAHPDTCSAPHRAIKAFAGHSGQLINSISNSTYSLLLPAGDAIITSVSNLQDSATSTIGSISSSTITLLTSPWHVITGLPYRMSSLASWMATTTADLATYTLTGLGEASKVTWTSFISIRTWVSHGFASLSLKGWNATSSLGFLCYDGLSSAFSPLMGSIIEGSSAVWTVLTQAPATIWSGLSSLPSQLSDLLSAPFSLLTSLWENLINLVFLVGSWGSSSMAAAASGASYAINSVTGALDKGATYSMKFLGDGYSLAIGSLGQGLSSGLWAVTEGFSLSSGAIGKGITSGCEVIWEGLTSALGATWSAGTSGIVSIGQGFISGGGVILDSITSAVEATWTAGTSALEDAGSSLATSVIGLGSRIWTSTTSAFLSLISSISSIDYLYPVTSAMSVVSSFFQSVGSALASVFAWPFTLDLWSPVTWTSGLLASSWNSLTNWCASLNLLSPLTTGWSLLTSTWNNITASISFMDLTAPFAWTWFSLTSMFSWMWSGLQDLSSSMLDYQGFSSLHLAPITWLTDTFSSPLYAMKDISINVYTTAADLSPLSWVWSLISSSSSSMFTAISATSALSGTILTTSVSSIGALLAAGWAQAMGMVRVDKPTASTMQELDIEKLIDRVLKSERFLSTVSEIANTKVDNEATKFQDQLALVLEKGSLTSEDQQKVSLEYQSKIDSIKLEVSNEIRKMTEEYMKMSLDTAEQAKVKAEAQDAVIQGLKMKYQQMLTEAEALKNGLDSQGQKNEGANQELVEEVNSLRAKILELEEEQTKLNATMTGCCKDLSMIEISVEQHLASLMESVMAGGEGGSHAARTFSTWLDSHLVAREELEASLTSLSADLDTKLAEVGTSVRKEAGEAGQQLMDKVSLQLREELEIRLQEVRAAAVDGAVPSVQGLNRTEVLEIVKNSLIQYDADKTGMFDYALETAGGSVVSTRCTETYVQKTAMYSIFGIPVWYPSNNPRTIIQPGVQPGECWAFKGSSGYIVIQLSEAIVPTRFSMEHISKTMSPSGKIDSAPKDFVVYGLRNEKDHDPVRLGAFSYSQDTDPLQFFEMPEAVSEAFPYVELDILSNHGNINYTCLYRFRVHGLRP